MRRCWWLMRARLQMMLHHSCHGLPHKDATLPSVMQPMKPRRARRGPGNPESATLKSRVIYASSNDAVKDKLMGIKPDYKQTALRRSRTTAPWQRSWGEASSSPWRADLPELPPAPCLEHLTAPDLPTGLQAARFLSDLGGAGRGSQQGEDCLFTPVAKQHPLPPGPSSSLHP